MEMTVKEVFDLLSKSNGFVLFVSFVEPKPDGVPTIEHRYMRQHFIPDDLDKSFGSFAKMVSDDLSKSGMNLIKSAKSIINQKLPALDNPIENTENS